MEIKVYLQIFPFGRNKYIPCGIKINNDLLLFPLFLSLYTHQ